MKIEFLKGATERVLFRIFLVIVGEGGEGFPTNRTQMTSCNAASEHIIFMFLLLLIKMFI